MKAVYDRSTAPPCRGQIPGGTLPCVRARGLEEHAGYERSQRLRWPPVSADDHGQFAAESRLNAETPDHAPLLIEREHPMRHEARAQAQRDQSRSQLTGQTDSTG